jgi:hypothetical protein
VAQCIILYPICSFIYTHSSNIPLHTAVLSVISHSAETSIDNKGTMRIFAYHPIFLFCLYWTHVTASPYSSASVAARSPILYPGSSTTRTSSRSRRHSSYQTETSPLSYAPTTTTTIPLSTIPFDTEVTLCHASTVASSRSLVGTLARGALLRIASDLTGGTPLESIKTRVTVYPEGPMEATRRILRDDGLLGLYRGTPSRTLEGALIGAVFMLGSTWTKTRVRAWGGSPTTAALAGGLVGGVAQALIMTPAGMVFTSLGYTRGKPGFADETAWSVTQRVVREKGIGGMYSGFNAMALRQATNWASRAGFTEIARSVFGWSKYGLLGELASGCLGGVGSCWNTPIETIRVVTQRDVSTGGQPRTMKQYWDDIKTREGYSGLFRGVTPRAIQAIWQTTFLVVVPNLMGI